MSILLQSQSRFLEIIADPAVTHHMDVEGNIGSNLAPAKAMTNKDFFFERVPLYL
jgi:hypothetical protein